MINKDDLSVLKGSKRVTEKVSVMFGSNDRAGVSHGLFEIIANSVDRYKKGFGKNVLVTREIDDTLIIKDFGDGLPMLWNDREQAYNWDIALKTLYGGGNYEQSDVNTGVLGTNGLGLTTAQYSSEFMEVTSCRADGKTIKANFKQGRPIDFKTGEFLVEDTNDFLNKEDGMKVLDISENDTNITGTTIRYRPSSEVFIETNIDNDWIKNKLLKQAVVNCGLELVFKDNSTGEKVNYIFDSPQDYLKELEVERITGIIRFKKDGAGVDKSGHTGKFDKKPVVVATEYKVDYDINLFFDNKTEKQEYIHNGSELTELKKNATTKGFEKAITRAIDKYMVENKLYKKAESHIRFEDIAPSVVSLVNTKSTLTSYSNQTKLSISNSFIEEFVSKEFEEQFTTYLTEQSDVAKIICNRIMINKKARESAENTRLNIKKKLESDTSPFSKPEGLIDCKSKIASERELFICEGKSALGSLIKARNSQYQACIPMRGKILNLLKNKGNIKKILGSEIVLCIIKALGCGVILDTKDPDMNNFDIKKLKYAKIIISSDGDVDGYQIRTLVLALLYVLCPQLIIDGYIYIVEAPLFEARVGKSSKIHYLYSVEEKNKFLEKNPTAKISRNKGLTKIAPHMSDCMLQTSLI